MILNYVELCYVEQGQEAIISNFFFSCGISSRDFPFKVGFTGKNVTQMSYFN